MLIELAHVAELVLLGLVYLTMRGRTGTPSLGVGQVTVDAEPVPAVSHPPTTLVLQNQDGDAKHRVTMHRQDLPDEYTVGGVTYRQHHRQKSGVVVYREVSPGVRR